MNTVEIRSRREKVDNQSKDDKECVISLYWSLYNLKYTWELLKENVLVIHNGKRRMI